MVEIGRNARRERIRCFSEQPLELDIGAPLELLLLRLHADGELLQGLWRQLAMLRRKSAQHMQIVEVAERFAKIVQRFGLRVQRVRPGAGDKRELVAQIDNASAKRMQRDRVVAAEGEASALTRLPIGARDRGDNVHGPNSA